MTEQEAIDQACERIKAMVEILEEGVVYWQEDFINDRRHCRFEQDVLLEIAKFTQKLGEMYCEQKEQNDKEASVPR